MQTTQTDHDGQTPHADLAAFATGEARLLFVTGSALYRRLMLGGLAAQGFQVTLAENAVAALRLRQGGPRFDVLMVDIDLPDMDALAFARSVRSGGLWSEQPLVAMSICPEPRRRSDESAAGFRQHVAVMDDGCLTRSFCM